MKEGGEGIEEFLASVRQISERNSSTKASVRQISERSSSIKKRDKKEEPKRKIQKWTSEEEKNFEDAVRLCGRNSKQIKDFLPTRTLKQIQMRVNSIAVKRTHYRNLNEEVKQIL